MHIREFGLFCIRLQEPVQHPLLLVGSVRLTMYGGLSETYPSEFDAMSEAILATYRLVAPLPLSSDMLLSMLLASAKQKLSPIYPPVHAPRIILLHELANCVDPVCRTWRRRSRCNAESGRVAPVERRHLKLDQ